MNNAENNREGTEKVQSLPLDGQKWKNVADQLTTLSSSNIEVT